MAATYSSLVGLAVGGKYEIRRVIGAGGMGVVCEAMHLDLGKRVALKLIDKSMKESDAIIARFKREAKAAGRIDSDHIVDVFDVNADARVGLYMVMEHLSGEDLQARLEKEKKIDTKTAVMIAHQIARGLAKAHEAGVIHRDLKPANVFLTVRDNGQLLVKLLDFGVSKILREAEGDSRITGTGTPIGTPLYMSPEQAEGKDDVDGRADIWSLGAVLYEALAGAPPFSDRGSYHGTIVGILTSRPKLLQDAAPWVPAELAKVVDAMLVHDRDARIPNAAAVTQRLLDAFPTVLPDGTGRHTAVIVSQAQAAVDTTGDTEVFTSPGLGPGIRITPVTPQPVTVPPSVALQRNSRQDSSKTVPDASTGETAALESPISDRTIAPTPVNLPARDASSSAQGVSLPGTPPAIDPLPYGDPGAITVPPALESNPAETIRDDELAARMDRKRRGTMLLLFVAIVGVAIGGYLMGRRASNQSTPNAVPPQPSVSAPAPSATPSATATPAPSATTASSATTAPSATAPTSIGEAASALPDAPATAPTTKPRKHVTPKATTATPTATTTSEKKAPTPYDEPPPPEPPPSY